MYSPDFWDGSRLSTLTQQELCVLLKSRTDQIIQQLGHKNDVYTDYVVRAVEVLNAMLRKGYYGDSIKGIAVESK